MSITFVVAAKLTSADTLPPEIQIELRANRSGTVLPDSHGQIWTELATCAEQDKSGKLFHGAREEVEIRMSRLLQLNGREQFPVRRLAILWKNDRWRAFVTRLCERKMGKDLFNISIFQELSSYRIDDFIFERLETGMVAAWTIWDIIEIELELNKDYQQLCSLMTTFRPRELFYPKCRDPMPVKEDSPRPAGFFKHLDNHTYFSLYENLVDYGRQIIFSNPQETLKRINAHGKVMQLVMMHVVMWLNDEPTKVNYREGNKPPLVDDLITSISSDMPVYAEREVTRAKALGLQRSVLTYVEEHAASFTEAAKKDYLDLMPDGEIDPLLYCERFRAGPWRDVLVRVRRVVGPNLKNAYVVRFNTVAPVDPPSPPRISLVDSLQRVILQHPEVTHDRTLNTPEAIETLRVLMEEAVQSWRTKRCGQSIFNGEPNRSMLVHALARTELAPQRRGSLPWVPHIVHKDHSKPALNLADSLFPTAKRRSSVERPTATSLWNKPNTSSLQRESVSSGHSANGTGISHPRPPSSVSPQCPTKKDGGLVHVDDRDPRTPTARESINVAQSTSTRDRAGPIQPTYQSSVSANRRKGPSRSATLQKKQQQGGWRTKPLARG